MMIPPIALIAINSRCEFSILPISLKGKSPKFSSNLSLSKERTTTKSLEITKIPLNIFGFLYLFYGIHAYKINQFQSVKNGMH